MEKFAIDLDRVLDEFELSEDLASSVDDFRNGTGGNVLPHLQLVETDGSATLVLVEDIVPCSRPPITPLSSTLKSLLPFDDDEGVSATIDLNEADFGAADFPALKNSDGDERSSGLDRDNSRLVSSGEAEDDAQSSAAESPLSTIANEVCRESDSGSCIKELHCDDSDVINKDYLVTFGRKVESSKGENEKHDAKGGKEGDEGETKLGGDGGNSAVEDGAASAASSAEAFGHPAPLYLDLVDEFEVTNRTDDLCALAEEACVTPDEDSGDSAVDMAPVVGFGTFVSVTDDDLDLYLRDQELECTGDQEEAVIEHSVHLKEAFHSPPPPPSLDNGEKGKDVGVEGVGSSGATELTAYEEEVTTSAVCSSRVGDDSLSSDTVCTHLNETTVVAASTVDPNTSLNGEECDDFVDRACTLVDAEADEGYEADETSPSDHFLPFCEELSPSDDHRLGIERPTSLRLPERIDYEPPPSPSQLAISPVDEDGHFSTLVSTAGSPDAISAPPSGSNRSEDGSLTSTPLTEGELLLGKVAPIWVPDAEAPSCMQCDAKFTLVKRRHHCRACGKVLCANCCGTKARLCYMDNKEARVCLSCVDVMKRVETAETQVEGGQWQSAASLLVPHWSPNPNIPSEYCSVIPPLQQAQPNAPPPTVMVPIGVLKRGSGRSKGEPKQVMFSDGIRPGGDLTELDGPEVPMPNRRQGRVVKKVEPKNAGHSSPLMSHPCIAQSQDYSLNDTLDMDKILPVLLDEGSEPVRFFVSRNLRVLVKIVNLDCCFHRMCWSFTTRGMGAVGQDEIVVLLEMLADERTIPLDVIHHLSEVYEDAGKGVTVSGMGHSIFTKSFLGSREHGGFLYVRPTFQCLNKLVLPSAPYLFAILLQKWETPWAKLFPLRLFLRLGAEFRYYPCPLVGIRFRKPVYCEIGHTIMNLLADFHNYQYTLPLIPGLVVHMEDKKTFISFPRNRYDETIKALNSSIDHVLALAATFSVDADSHLVCIQSDDGSYHTQAINIRDKPRQVTGASFVVFNGALKTSSGLTAKSSIVEDGLMVQISSDSMQSLRQSLRDMKDYVITCGAIGTEHPEEVVHLRWVEDDRTINIGVESPIDGMSMDGISSIRIHCGTDYVGDGLVIRWTEVYLVKSEEGHRSDPIDLAKVSDSVARACCLALTAHLVELFSSGLVRIGLRVTLDSENVGYEIGAGGERLSQCFMNDLDSELVPAIHGAAPSSQEGPIVLELIFHILEQ